MRPEDLPKQTPDQVTFGQLKHEVPRMSKEASADLEQALLEARQRPVLDGDRQDQPTQPPSNRRTSLAWKRWQESRVQMGAVLPSLIQCSAVPRWLWKRTTARFVPVR